MNRETMYLEIDRLIVTRSEFDDTATAILDTILPQITTVEELEALPEGSVAVDKDGDAWVFSGGWTRAKHVTGFATASAAAHRGPLTLVWRPE